MSGLGDGSTSLVLQSGATTGTMRTLVDVGANAYGLSHFGRQTDSDLSTLLADLIVSDPQHKDIIMFNFLLSAVSKPTTASDQLDVVTHTEYQAALYLIRQLLGSNASSSAQVQLVSMIPMCYRCVTVLELLALSINSKLKFDVFNEHRGEFHRATFYLSSGIQNELVNLDEEIVENYDKFCSFVHQSEIKFDKTTKFDDAYFVFGKYLDLPSAVTLIHPSAQLLLQSESKLLKNLDRAMALEQTQDEIEMVAPHAESGSSSTKSRRKSNKGGGGNKRQRASNNNSNNSGNYGGDNPNYNPHAAPAAHMISKQQHKEKIATMQQQFQDQGGNDFTIDESEMYYLGDNLDFECCNDPDFYLGDDLDFEYCSDPDFGL
ncbi:hypothetical protein ScalyP_jg9748 [Parmales sp. scaly parma]|nr:hypothetical protein ScalyP_jg9748 [Parmales sp. scaly parma]